MTKIDFQQALLLHLIASFPNPFAPNATTAKQCVDAARAWADELGKLEGSLNTLVF